jgi:putative peptide zinc metalloprotease protein
MPVDRPTFSESWYRVAQLRPRLRSALQTHRQHYRGDMWHVVQDPSNNQFFRLNEAAYRFVALLDGSRTVAEVWKICNEQLGDAAPTQGEAIQLLGQLYTSNLLQGDMPPDAEGLFRRYRKRVTREIQGYLTNLLFIRIPVYDPDRFLDRFLPVFGWLFSWVGAVLWLALVGTGLYFVAGRTDALVSRAQNILDPDQLPLLYLSFVLVKVFHEFGHAYACKKFGRVSGSGGEVHVMGVMLLVFTPLPYVDASSSWALRNKWHRVIVGTGGMLVELGVAALAAVVWSQTGEGTTVHTIAYNVMFIASVSTLLFNANPLLRYDGYYILSDLLEIPNLAQRSKDYLYYLIKKYAWGVRQPRNPSHSRSEGAWLLVYAVASTVYRVFISIAILLFVTDFLPFIGALLATAAVIAWLIVPLGKFLHYLATSGELARTRLRAVVTSIVFPLLVLGGLGMIPAPDRFVIEGVVEPVDMKVVHAGMDGFVQTFQPSGTDVAPDGAPVVVQDNPVLRSQHGQLLAQRRELAARRGTAIMEEQAAIQILDEQIAALDTKVARTEQQLADLEVRAPLAGQWISPDVDRLRGAYVARGEALGLVVTTGNLIVRAVAGQDVAGTLMREADPVVDMRVAHRPDQELAGRIKQFLPAGRERLPSPALGFAAGGPIAVKPDDKSGTQTAERVFEIHVTPDPDGGVRLLAGQRVVIRFHARRKPLLAQGWRALLQMLQRRFHV